MGLTHITNHIIQALNRLPQQYRGKERMSALISSFINQVQEVEDVFHDLKTDRTLDNSVGVQLDGIGQIVGLPRVPGQDDEDYRKDLDFQIILNMNEATPEELIAAAKFFTDSETIEYNELYPAALAIFVPIVLSTDDQGIIRTKLKKLAAAGVSLSEFGFSDPDNPFLFDEGNGLGDTSNPATGGLLADLYT